MIREYWILIIGVGLVTALRPVPHKTSEESLRSAMNAVTRKQRSLSSNSQDFYIDLPVLDAQDINDQRKLRRQQVGGAEEYDDNDAALAFIPTGTGQMETIGDGYQHLNNKQLDRALMDYLQYETEQEEGNPSRPQTSVFRERVRTGSRKRTGNLETSLAEPRINGREQLIKLLLGLENEVEPNELILDELPPSAAQNYRRILQTAYDKYGDRADENIYGPELSEAAEQLILSKLAEEDNERDEMQSPRGILSNLPSAERRNVNARYPLFDRSYDAFMAKRSYPVAKRSAKALNKRGQNTDPKVAQDLDGLFGAGGQSSKSINKSQEHDHDHNNHDRGHAHDHEHEHIKSANLEDKNNKAAVANKTVKERSIQLRKKSVDWSQYFGIDRRKKKTVYAAKPGSQDQDDEYLLQKYYEIMAENLSPAGKSGSDKREKLQRQLSAKSRNRLEPIYMSQQYNQAGFKNDMLDNDELVSRLATAYSLEKLRRALNELSNSRNAGNGVNKNQQKSTQTASNNLTATNLSTSTNNAKQNHENKRRDNLVVTGEDVANEDYSCSHLEIIEALCMAHSAAAMEFQHLLIGPCIAYQVCNACEKEECYEKYVLETEMACIKGNYQDDSLWNKVRCRNAALYVIRDITPVRGSSLCRLDDVNLQCLIEFQNRYPHPSLYSDSYQNNLRKRRQVGLKR